ncbi:MAG: M42 family metallopeptidase [bacterium]|nr:M42 family metallopeptidase [bacterium]
MTSLTLDIRAMTTFLVDLLNTPSPTGYYPEAIELVQTAFEELNMPNLSLSVTRKGALLGKLTGVKHDAPVAVTAHIDTLGLMVKEIKSNGRLKCINIGGILWGAIESEGVTIRTHTNKRIRGSIHPANTSVHVNSKIKSIERNEETVEIRLDERTTSEAETRALGIGVGDFVFVDPRVEVTDSGFIRGRFLDDKAGVAAIYGALMALKHANLTPPQDVYILIANYEEVGHGGAAGFPDNLAELLSVDMGAIGVGQAGDEFSVSICVKDGGGPYHFEMNNKLRGLAETYNIPHKVDIYLYYSSDGTAYWRAGGAARVGLAGPGVDASHAYERTHQDALHHSAHLLARYMLAEGA